MLNKATKTTAALALLALANLCVACGGAVEPTVPSDGPVPASSDPAPAAPVVTAPPITVPTIQADAGTLPCEAMDGGCQRPDAAADAGHPSHMCEAAPVSGETGCTGTEYLCWDVTPASASCRQLARGCEPGATLWCCQ
jgi:hypothetical protein